MKWIASAVFEQVTGRQGFDVDFTAKLRVIFEKKWYISFSLVFTDWNPSGEKINAQNTLSPEPFAVNIPDINHRAWQNVKTIARKW